MNGEFNDASIEQIKQKLDQRGLPQKFSKNILSVDQAFIIYYQRNLRNFKIQRNSKDYEEEIGK
jgi:hypothetical protein